MIRKAPWLKSWKIFDLFIDKILDYRPYIPFTAPNTVWRALDKSAVSILDVGSGRGGPMEFINRHRQFRTVGVDLFERYLREAQISRIHDSYALCDVRALPFQRKSFDVVLCLEVLEHLTNAEADNFLKALEEIARKQVVLSTPVGEYHQEEFDDNEHQHHESEWEPADLEKRGFRVVGVGVRGLGGDHGLTSKLPLALRPIHFAIWLLAGPVARRFPKMAGHMIAVKAVSEK